MLPSMGPNQLICSLLLVVLAASSALSLHDPSIIVSKVADSSINSSTIRLPHGCADVDQLWLDATCAVSRTPGAATRMSSGKAAALLHGDWSLAAVAVPGERPVALNAAPLRHYIGHDARPATVSAVVLTAIDDPALFEFTLRRAGSLPVGVEHALRYTKSSCSGSSSDADGRAHCRIEYEAHLPAGVETPYELWVAKQGGKASRDADVFVGFRDDSAVEEGSTAAAAAAVDELPSFDANLLSLSASFASKVLFSNARGGGANSAAAAGGVPLIPSPETPLVGSADLSLVGSPDPNAPTMMSLRTPIYNFLGSGTADYYTLRPAAILTFPPALELAMTVVVGSPDVYLTLSNATPGACGRPIIHIMSIFPFVRALRAYSVLSIAHSSTDADASVTHCD